MTLAHAQELALNYPLGETLPAPGRTLEVADGVRWLRMPLPFALNHINLWLLRDEIDGRQGWTAVDCGVATDTTRGHWQQIFDDELQGLPLLRVVCTHMHPDHVGLAHWLCERFSSERADTPGHECRLWISATDWTVARLAIQSPDSFGGAASADFFARHGLSDPQALAQLRQRKSYYADLVPSLPARYRRLMDGMTLQVAGRQWVCKVGYGHAPEHMALHCPALDLLIAGDMVLPRISTNVAVVESEPEGNPLPLFLDSLTRLRALPASTLVLPSHGKPFVGLHTRIEQLHSHHRDRLADVLQACAAQPCSAADLLPVLFKRTLDLHQTTLAMGESIAHVHALVGTGHLLPHDSGDGVLRWTALG